MAIVWQQLGDGVARIGLKAPRKAVTTNCFVYVSFATITSPASALPGRVFFWRALADGAAPHNEGPAGDVSPARAA